MHAIDAVGQRLYKAQIGEPKLATRDDALLHRLPVARAGLRVGDLLGLELAGDAVAVGDRVLAVPSGRGARRRQVEPEMRAHQVALDAAAELVEPAEVELRLRVALRRRKCCYLSDERRSEAWQPTRAGRLAARNRIKPLSP